MILYICVKLLLNHLPHSSAHLVMDAVSYWHENGSSHGALKLPLCVEGSSLTK
ncbi:hypothetical protein SETIT_4G147900v2 [Setaria italica]|uniref:Uncharacterized protein n=1 Tax=Setaria italica TaxID=4555 RepID=A0A368QUB6_SETIT|nr:hypothetical protein SETIT_4G147900v2 [Setaria italica]RCV21547.1 hypothetical protein SETIT_4G147900v2 [Setaria italica]